MQTDSAVDAIRNAALPLMQRVYLGNSLRDWVVAAVTFAVTLSILLAARWLVIRRLEPMSRRTETRIDEYIVALLENTRYSFLVMLALGPALKLLVLPERVSSLVIPMLRLVVIIQVGLWLAELITLQLRTLTKRRAATDVASVTTIRAAGLIIQLVLWVVIFLVILRNFGVDVTALLTTLGIAGIAAALAVQNILSDLLASLSIVLDKPFVVGDFIVLDEFAGTVEEIGLKTTRLRSLSGERLIFSNGDLLKSRIRNYKDMKRRRIVFSFGLDFGTPRQVLERVPEVVREVIEGVEQAAFDRSHFLKFGDSALVFETVYFVTVPDYTIYMDVQQQINLDLYDRITELGASFAFPVRRLILDPSLTEGLGGRSEAGDRQPARLDPSIQPVGRDPDGGIE